MHHADPPWSLWSVARFDPITATLAIGSAVMSAVGAVSSGIAQNNAAKYSAAVDHNNAVQAQDAADAQSVVSAQQTQTKLGAQAAAYGASGVQTGTGSALDVMSDTAVKGRMDAMTLRYGGGITAGRDIAAGQLATMQGQAAQTAGFLNAGTTLLSSASKLAPDSAGSG